MKKLAILINGSMRITTQAIVECIENYKQLFEFMQPDIWALTWKTEDNREEEIRPHVYKLVADEISPTQESIAADNISWTQQLVAYPEHKIVAVSNYAMVYGMSYLFDKVIESGEKYEYALRARNDLYFNSNIQEWKNIVDQQSNAYVTPPNLWCSGYGANDHVGFGKFDIVRNIWKYDYNDYNETIKNSWNIETYMQTMIGRNAEHKIVDVDSYILRRTGRTDINANDWIMR